MAGRAVDAGNTSPRSTMPMLRLVARPRCFRTQSAFGSRRSRMRKPRKRGSGMGKTASGTAGKRLKRKPPRIRRRLMHP